MKQIGWFLVALAFFAPQLSTAQELVDDTVVTMKARVLEVISQEMQPIPGTSVEAVYQTIRVEILDGEEKGNIVIVENDYLELKAGTVFYLSRTTNNLDGTDYYSVSEPYRLPALFGFLALFVVVVVFLGGKQGIRGLLALSGGLLCIIWLLLPGILAGYPPILVSIGVASIIVVLGSYVTHGFNKTTSMAVLGMIATIAATGVLAYASIPLAQLTGIASEETVYLNMNAGGAIDLAGLLVSAMLIGTLGVLYDAAIGQAVSVEELAAAGAHLSRREIYRRALRIGREHIGALVNTLAIAYVGAALPILLLFFGYGSDSILMAINREIFATEIVRALVGSIGIILTVPITTAIATRLLVPKTNSSASTSTTA